MSTAKKHARATPIKERYESAKETRITEADCFYARVEQEYLQVNDLAVDAAVALKTLNTLIEDTRKLRTYCVQEARLLLELRAEEAKKESEDLNKALEAAVGSERDFDGDE